MLLRKPAMASIRKTSSATLFCSRAGCGEELVACSRIPVVKNSSGHCRGSLVSGYIPMSIGVHTTQRHRILSTARLVTVILVSLTHNISHYTTSVLLPHMTR